MSEETDKRSAPFTEKVGYKVHKLHIGIIDLVANAPTRSLYARMMHANYASIMPQAIATWCEEEGHNITLVCYTGFEDLSVFHMPDMWGVEHGASNSQIEWQKGRNPLTYRTIGAFMGGLLPEFLQL